MHTFTEVEPSIESYWRSVILFGRNVASYKFALGRALQNKSSVTLEELAEPYAPHLCAHLANVDRQGTSQSSKFLDACRELNAGEITKDVLIETTVRLGFNNVLDAFHVVNRDSIPVTFFEVDTKRGTKGLVITDNLNYLGEGEQFRNLPYEVESRWSLYQEESTKN